MKFKDMISSHERLEDRINTIANEISEIQYNHKVHDRAYGNINDFDVGHQNINVTFVYQHCSSCGPEYSNITFPIDYLDDENWKDKYIDSIIKLKKKKKEENEKRAKKEKEEKEVKEREQYEKLKEKYEDK